jgi:hypothetical protein
MRSSLTAITAITIALGGLAVTASPAQAATPRVLAVGKRYPAAVERWRPLVKRYFPHTDHGQVPRRIQQEALAIIQAESGGSVRSRPMDGIWQLSRDHGTRYQRMDPTTATRIAARLYLRAGHRWSRSWTTARRLGIR